MKKPSLKMETVQSSNIAAIGHIKQDRQMIVEFHNGSTYKYYPVDIETFESILYAESVGASFNKLVKSDEDISYSKIL